jgi:hypothetical protein
MTSLPPPQNLALLIGVSRTQVLLPESYEQIPLFASIEISTTDLQGYKKKRDK